MKEALIVYDGLDQKTELLSDQIREYLSIDYQVRQEDINQLNLDKLEKFDLILLGSAGSNFKMSQESFISLYNILAEREIDLSGQKGALFCPIDKSEDNFCESVDVLEDELDDLGLDIAVKGLKLIDEGLTVETKDKIKNWIDELLAL